MIIPVYNTAEYLPRCIESIVNSTYHNLEIICVNDGSTDDSLQVLKMLAAGDNRISIISKENSGVSSARNAGLDAAHGSLISFIDSDDWIHFQFFEILAGFYEKTHAQIVCCDCQITQEAIPDAPLDLKKLEYEEHTFFDCLNASIGSKQVVYGKLYNADLVKAHRFDARIRFGEDTMYNVGIFANNTDDILVIIRTPLYYYFMRNDSAAHTISNGEYIFLCDRYLSMFSKSCDPRVSSIFLFEAFKCIFSYRYFEMFNSNRDLIKNNVDQRLNKCIQILHSMDYVSPKTRFQYLALSKFPTLYRIWRIRQDPTLLQWEKKMRVVQK